MTCSLCHSDKVIIREKHTRNDLLKTWEWVGNTIEEEVKLEEINIYQCKNCSLQFFDPLLAGGNKFYSELGKFDWDYGHSGKTEYDYVQKHIRDGDKILDIGSGSGVLFTKITKKVDYTGLELSSKAVELAKEAGINVLQENFLKYAALHKSSFDLVCLFQVLEHLTDLDNFIKSIHLALKPKGLFVIAVPDNDGFISEMPNNNFNLPPHHVIHWTETSLCYLAKKYEFEVIEVERELLQDIHKEGAYLSYIGGWLRKFRFRPTLLIDHSKNYGYIAWKARHLYSKGWFRSIILPFVKKRQKYGQSIIITLQKK